MSYETPFEALRSQIGSWMPEDFGKRQIALATLAEAEDMHQHLLSERRYEQDRGYRTVYRHEWEAFNQWQRHGREALRRTTAALDDAIKAAVNGDWSQEDYDEWHAAREQAESVSRAVFGGTTQP